MTEYFCQNCKKQYEKTHHSKKYCSDDCRINYNNTKRRKEKEVVECLNCFIKIKKNATNQIYCSVSCRKERYRKDGRYNKKIRNKELKKKAYEKWKLKKIKRIGYEQFLREKREKWRENYKTRKNSKKYIEMQNKKWVERETKEKKNPKNHPWKQRFA